MATPTPGPVSPTQTSPLVAVITTLIGNLSVAAVSFGVFNNTTAAVVVTALTGFVSGIFMIANELRHKTNSQA